jgi:two-component system, OmpR family, sensor histidine kinase CpxA
MMRSIYAKIFWWFWAAILLVGCSVGVITFLSGSQGFGQRWLAQSLDLYAASAVDFYSHGGKPALRKYLDDIQQSTGINSTLIDPYGNNILSRPIPPAAANVYARARVAGQSRFHTRLVWTGASIVPTEQGNYFLVAQVSPTGRLFDQASPSAALLKLTAAMLAAGLLCLLLARHIANPIRTLQQAAGRIADGDLSVRATPLIPPRNDELADLAHDFDRMAERIQSLLAKQHELLGDISHELRSPLTRMSVSLELARRGDAASLSRMQVEIEKLDALIGQILMLTRLQVQQSQSLTDTVNLRALLESVAADAAYEGQQENKSVSLDAPGDVWIAGNPALLRSAIENVVRNAIRYSPANGRVEIHLALQQNGAARSPGSSAIAKRSFANTSHATAQLLIQDSGEGVPPEALGKLFEPFYRVSDARDRSTGGSGLGLAIAQKVVEYHRGSISASNRAGGGLQVKMLLPAKELPPNEHK